MGLKWKDVDFLRGSILVTRSVVDQAVGNCKTEASRKPVVMGPYIAQALVTWRQESPYADPEDWVWASPHKKGMQPLWLSTIMRYYIQPAAKRAGITKKIGWHTFRHTFATLVMYLNVEDRVVQEMMRHASPRLLDRYVQTLEGAKRQAQEQLVGSIVGPVQVMQA